MALKIPGKPSLGGLKEKAANAASNIDVSAIKEKAAQAGSVISAKAADIKDTAVSTKEDITEKLTELDRMLEASITEYNDAYTLMNDKGIQLFIEHSRAVDTIAFVENLVNSIANRPKSFDADFAEIDSHRVQFTDAREFGERELHDARVAASGAGAGLAAGASVAFMGPATAMWVATTFGTASTGTAIASLSGAAATNAALAWLGGGALAAGGGGMAAGSAFLTLAGPVGWGVAGASLLGSIILFAKKRNKLNKQKNEEIEAVKENTEKVKELDASIFAILNETREVRTGCADACMSSVSLYNRDYTSFTDEEKLQIGNLVNTTKALSAMLGKTVE